MKLALRPTTIKAASAFVREHHRHHTAPQGGLFAVAVACGDEVRGVAIIGRPVSRHLADGYTAEVTRVCTLGDKNAPSMLYGAAWRAARALGYKRLVTYTLVEEPGTSLRAAGWIQTERVKGRTWARPKRGREDKHPTTDKLRWEVAA